MVFILSFVVSVCVYYGTGAVGRVLIEKFSDSLGYVEKQNNKYIDRFENYVSENSVSAEDFDAIDEYIDSFKIAYAVIAVYRNGNMVYSSVSSLYSEQEESFTETYDGEAVKTIAFSDGEASVHFYGFFDEQFYTASFVASVFLAMFCFVFIFTYFIQKKIKYVRRLEEDIKILETGGLDHEVAVVGKDELATFAESLNLMRESLKDNIQKEDEAVKANNKLVISVAHDLRTPLTALLLYLSLLKKGGYTEEEGRIYIDKSYIKANQIKKMTDALFERFLITRDSSIAFAEPQKVQAVFEDGLSDIISFLTDKQFEFECDIDWPDEKISVIPDYISRISDNICSNILKYADRSSPIKISVEKADGCIVVTFANKVVTVFEKTESYGMGVDNIKTMMSRMGGKCYCGQEGDCYRISLIFKL